MKHLLHGVHSRERSGMVSAARAPATRTMLSPLGLRFRAGCLPGGALIHHPWIGELVRKQCMLGACKPWRGRGRCKMQWILIVWFIGSSPGANALTTAEFYSKDACEAAGQAFVAEAAKDASEHARFICSAKGRPKP